MDERKFSARVYITGGASRILRVSFVCSLVDCLDWRRVYSEAKVAVKDRTNPNEGVSKVVIQIDNTVGSEVIHRYG